MIDYVIYFHNEWIDTYLQVKIALHQHTLGSELLHSSRNALKAHITKINDVAVICINPLAHMPSHTTLQYCSMLNFIPY